VNNYFTSVFFIELNCVGTSVVDDSVNCFKNWHQNCNPGVCTLSPLPPVPAIRDELLNDLLTNFRKKVLYNCYLAELSWHPTTPLVGVLYVFKYIFDLLLPVLYVNRCVLDVSKPACGFFTNRNRYKRRG
jgi:hypothetical protein